MLNKVILIGTVTSDGELKTIKTGTSVLRFRMATTKSWRDRSGNLASKSTTHTIVVWGKLGEEASSKITKGVTLHVEGEIQVRKYEDKYYTEIIANAVYPIEGLKSTINKPVGTDKPAPRQKEEELEFDEGDDLPF